MGPARDDSDQIRMRFQGELLDQARVLPGEPLDPAVGDRGPFGVDDPLAGGPLFGEGRLLHPLCPEPVLEFAVFEHGYSDIPRSVPSAGAALVPPAHDLDALGRAGFDVLSLANNHILDGGREVMLENRRAGGRHLRRRREPRGSPRSRDP